MYLYFSLQLEIEGRMFLYIRCISESCKYLHLKDQIKQSVIETRMINVRGSIQCLGKSKVSKLDILKNQKMLFPEKRGKGKRSEQQRKSWKMLLWKIFSDLNVKTGEFRTCWGVENSEWPICFGSLQLFCWNGKKMIQWNDFWKSVLFRDYHFTCREEKGSSLIMVRCCQTLGVGEQDETDSFKGNALEPVFISI